MILQNILLCILQWLQTHPNTYNQYQTVLVENGPEDEANTLNCHFYQHRILCLAHCVLIVLLLLQYGDTPLIVAAMGGHTDAVKELLSSGATVDLVGQVSAWKYAYFLLISLAIPTNIIFWKCFCILSHIQSASCHVRGN